MRLETCGGACILLFFTGGALLKEISHRLYIPLVCIIYGTADNNKLTVEWSD